MNLELEIEFSKAPIFAELDALKKQIEDQRPLPADVEGRVMQKLRLDWNYNSNAIEGNKLTYGETVAFLMEGITAKGKPLKDHLDIRGHNEAIHFLTDLVKDDRGITESDIRALHKMILVERYKVDAQTDDGKPTTKWVEIGEYKSTANHVQTSTGEIHYYASPEEVRLKMPELIEWYNEAKSNKDIHPVVVAALFHHKFVAIHPFDDGNGRLSRILMNLILMQNGFPPAVVKMDDRKNYYSLLGRADNNDTWPFVEYIAERVESSLNVYVKAIEGGDVDEDEDIDKEIALFKMELQNEIISSEGKSEQVIKRVFSKEIQYLVGKIFNKAMEFDMFFTTSPKYLDYKIVNRDGDTTLRANYRPDVDWQFDALKFDEFKVIEITCVYKNFKNNSSFMSYTTWYVEFNPYNYIISDSEKQKLFIKYYNESLTEREKNNIVKLYIQNIQKNINKALTANKKSNID